MRENSGYFQVKGQQKTFRKDANELSYSFLYRDNDFILNRINSIYLQIDFGIMFYHQGTNRIYSCHKRQNFLDKS